MAAGTDAKPAGGRWKSSAAVDAAVASVTFLIGVAVMADTWRLGAGWGPSGPQSGYFPFRIGLIICLASAVIAGRALWQARRGGEPFVQWARLRLVLAVLVPTLAYVAGIALLGIYTASALFIAGFMRIGGRYGWVKTAVVSIASAVILFWLFEIEFLVPLPKGPIEALLGY